MNDLDLEELESQLYSQVYHGINEEITENNIKPHSGTNNLSKPTDDMRKPGRYFGPWTPGSRFQARSALKQTSLKANKDLNKADGYKNYSKQQPRDISVDQVVVVSANTPFVFMNSRERNKAKWKARLKEKMKQKRANKRKERENKRKELESVTITLSDSDDNDDTCIVVEKKLAVVSLVDSDDENKAGEPKLEKVDDNVNLSNKKLDSVNIQSDDVIFVEPVVVPPEIINIDEESEILEKASSTSSDTIHLNTSPRKENSSTILHKERKELLSTPDSASNDFISNSGVELNKGNFNFSLHGSDFHSGEFLKPAPKCNETCETESSSSTTDTNPANLMKNIVFNEIDFPKVDIFSENNLESFGNFITPLRKSTNVTNVQSSPARLIESPPKNVYTSDSSSESDLEESQIDVAQKKNLPELSPMIACQEINRDIPQVPKRIKNLSTFYSKYDLLDSVSPEISAKEIKQKSKKKKKGKKKKLGETDHNEESAEISAKEIENSPKETAVVESENTDDEAKRKKRKINYLEDENFEYHPKRRSISEISEEKKIAGKTVEQPLGNSTDENIGELNLLLDEVKSNSESLITKSDNILEDSTLNKVKIQDSEIDNEYKATTSKEALFDVRKNDETYPRVNRFSESHLEDLVIIDETFDKSATVVSSDSESVLSALNENSDIKFNIQENNSNGLVISQASNNYNLSLKNLQQKMSDDPHLWEILESDRYPSLRNKGTRCNRCKQWGHIAMRCPKKLDIKCSLCGARGHFEPRCPNKICTQCGKPSPYSTTYCNSCFKLRNYQCSICAMPGHLPESCPDLWRRYHLTTEDGPIITQNGPTLKENDKLWCSGCAQSGHLEHFCNFYKSIYPISDPSVKSYDDVYSKQVTPRYSQGSQFKKNEESPPIRQPYFGENYSNMNNQQYQGFTQSRINFNENNYSLVNSNLNQFFGDVFLNNQQNYYSPVQQNVIQLPETDYSGKLNPYAFENVLPNYISFESNHSQQRADCRDLPNPNMRLLRDTLKSNHSLSNRNALFFSSSAMQLQHFIKDELHRLGKLSLLSNKLIKELKTRRVPERRNFIGRAEYYETLNMLFFGVMNMIDGKMHLERLKKFKRDKLKHRVSADFRRMLYKSYCYIFGCDKHSGVHYRELLMRI